MGRVTKEGVERWEGENNGNTAFNGTAVEQWGGGGCGWVRLQSLWNYGVGDEGRCGTMGGRWVRLQRGRGETRLCVEQNGGKG